MKGFYLILKKLLFITTMLLMISSCNKKKHNLDKNYLNGLWFTFDKKGKYKEFIYKNDSFYYADEDVKSPSFSKFTIKGSTLFFYKNDSQYSENFKPVITYINDSVYILENDDIKDTLKRYSLGSFNIDSLLNNFTIFSNRTNFWNRRNSIIPYYNLDIDTFRYYYGPSLLKNPDSLIIVP
ncbi:MAG TPA: hypothetical protein VE912_02805 [Bacteroidales bacterium]|nr:hypothetical protein [Bacteroidales bacterium]